MTSIQEARGIQSTFTYDSLNRLTQISYSDSTPTANYFYDSQTLPSGAPSFTQNNTTGRLRGMTYGSGSAAGNYFSYDAVGRVVTQKQLTASATYNLNYTYNHAGMLTSETYPSSRVVSYAYDEGGRLSSVGDGTTTFASSLGYGADGALTSETFGNTAVHTRTYNRRFQATQAKLSLGSTVLQQYDYGYGNFNASTGATDTSTNSGQIGSIKGTIGTTVQWLQGFQYDELGRLSNVAEYQGASMGSQTYTHGYTYDRYGNRFQSANSTLGLPAVTSSEIAASTNRFINSGSTPTTYDASGNITQDTKFRGTTYAYDANGRMTSASTGSISQAYTYDCQGQKVRTTVTVSSTNSYRTLVYDIFGQLVADYNGSAGTILESENVYRSGQLLARLNAPTSTWNYMLVDVQGSTRAVVNNNGGSSSVIARHDYLPFGEEIASGVGLRSSGQGYGATDYNRLRYAVTEREDVIGLDHTPWRKYESRSGRWTSPDPYIGSMLVVNPQSFNRYTYTENDPVNFVDPSGLLRMCWGGFYLGDGVYAPQVCFDFPEFDPFEPKEPPIPEPPGDGAGYNHTHINFYSNFATRTRVDPRKLFCKEFGF